VARESVNSTRTFCAPNGLPAGLQQRLKALEAERSFYHDRLYEEGLRPSENDRERSLTGPSLLHRRDPDMSAPVGRTNSGSVANSQYKITAPPQAAATTRSGLRAIRRPEFLLRALAQNQSRQRPSNIPSALGSGGQIIAPTAQRAPAAKPSSTPCQPRRRWSHVVGRS